MYLYMQGDSELIIQILWENREYVRKMVLYRKDCILVYVKGTVFSNPNPNIALTFLELVSFLHLFPLLIWTSMKPFTSLKTPKISLMTFIQSLHYLMLGNFLFNFVRFTFYLFFFSWFVFSLFVFILIYFLLVYSILCFLTFFVYEF